ncbi:SAM-dependent chlorinase/fluorinase [Candidatus Fermentibacteria bacterium]|nr:SAM-dependent chlorinase/fluorinase [Candidatus Fermentibacteria bacterium]
MTDAHPIITLTTDFGLDDPYVGVMKGVILQICPTCHLVDLAHTLSQGDVLRASFALRAALEYFPQGTVHLVVVDPGVGSARHPVAVHGRGMYFVGPDNGLFWFLADDDPPPRVVTIQNRAYVLPRTSSTFHGRDIFAPVAAYLARGVRLEELGPPLRTVVRLDLPRPQRISSHRIGGAVIYVDHFGNCISNIAPEELGIDLTRGSWTVRCDAGQLPVRRFYSEVDAGTPLAVIGSSGHVELSVRDGSAALQLDLGPGAPFVIERLDG